MSREPKRKALIIAISEYNDKLLAPLEFCKNDGEKMYELLRSLRYEISDNHKLIGYVEFDKIRDAIYDFFDNRKTNADDTLLFYYSGHGIPISGGNTCLASSEIDYYSPRKMGFSSYDLVGLFGVFLSLTAMIMLAPSVAYELRDSAKLMLKRTGYNET